MPFRIPTRSEPNPLLERQAARESNARSYPRRIPLALRRAEGIYVEDVQGRVFIDCLAGAGTLALGHNHPVVIAAIEETLKDGLPLHTLDLTTPVKDRFVQELFEILPAELARRARIQFCGPTGSDADRSGAEAGQNGNRSQYRARISRRVSRHDARRVDADG